jgi:hypothetical protein
MWVEEGQKNKTVSKNFGFFIEISQKKTLKTVGSMLKRITELREFVACEKSPQNIVLHLKEMGIG